MSKLLAPHPRVYRDVRAEQHINWLKSYHRLRSSSMLDHPLIQGSVCKLGTKRPDSAASITGASFRQGSLLDNNSTGSEDGEEEDAYLPAASDEPVRRMLFGRQRGATSRTDDPFADDEEYILPSLSQLLLCDGDEDDDGGSLFSCDDDNDVYSNSSGSTSSLPVSMTIAWEERAVPVQNDDDKNVKKGCYNHPNLPLSLSFSASLNMNCSLSFEWDASSPSPSLPDHSNPQNYTHIPNPNVPVGLEEQDTIFSAMEHEYLSKFRTLDRPPFQIIIPDLLSCTKITIPENLASCSVC